jgi:hypothetical protein
VRFRIKEFYIRLCRYGSLRSYRPDGVTAVSPQRQYDVIRSLIGSAETLEYGLNMKHAVLFEARRLTFVSFFSSSIDLGVLEIKKV